MFLTADDMAAMAKCDRVGVHAQIIVRAERLEKRTHVPAAAAQFQNGSQGRSPRSSGKSDTMACVSGKKLMSL